MASVYTSELLGLIVNHRRTCERTCPACHPWAAELDRRIPPLSQPVEIEESVLPMTVDEARATWDGVASSARARIEEQRGGLHRDFAIGNAAGVFEFHRGNISAVRHGDGVSLCHRRSGEAVGRWVVVDDGDIDDAIAALTAVRRAR